MTDYQAKAAVLQAKKFDGTQEMAKTVQDWLGTGFTVLWIVNMAGTHEPLLTIQSPEGMLHVETGSYAVRQEGAPLISMRAAAFEAMFHTAGNA